MFYLYYCGHCAQSFEVNKPLSKASEPEDCPCCGQKAERKYTAISNSFGWRLTDASHQKWHKDEIEKAI